MSELNVEEMLLGRIRGLNHVRRYATLPVLRAQSVSEHSFWVAYYAMNIGRFLERNGRKVDMGVLLERAISHDIEESVLGDIIRQVKHSVPGLKDSMQTAGQAVMLDLATALYPGDDHAQDQYVAAWKNAKSADIEGQIIDICDLFCVLSYLFEEAALGNRVIDTKIGLTFNDFMKGLLERQTVPLLKRVVSDAIEIIRRAKGDGMHLGVPRPLAGTQVTNREG